MPATPKKTSVTQWRKSKNPPKILIDTNLFVSGLLSSGSSPAKLIERLSSKHYQLCLSGPIFREYQAVIHRFARISKHKRQKLLGKIRQHALWFSPTEELNIIQRDPTDNKFLECAAVAQADFLVTGDDHLLALGSFRQTRILTLSRFNKLLGWR